MTDELKPHRYHPSYMHMGDCSVCGNLADDPIHAFPAPSPSNMTRLSEAKIAELRADVHGALQDSAYLAGAKAGWNAAQAADPNAAYAKLMASHDGYLKPLIEARRIVVREGGKS